MRIRTGASIPNKTIWETISDGKDLIPLGDREVNSRAYVARFNFSGTDQQKKLSQLSGGERNRVHLARTLKTRRERHPSRRAHERSRREHDARARGRARELRRMRRGDQPRSLVPRPHRDAHPRVRKRQLGVLVRGELLGLRGRPPPPPRRRRRPAAPDQVPAPDEGVGAARRLRAWMSRSGAAIRGLCREVRP